MRRSAAWRTLMKATVLATGLLLSFGSFAAKRTLNSYFPVNFKDAAYQKAALDKVLKAWAVPARFPAVGKKTVVQSTIGRDGKLVGAVTSLKSGVKEWDDAALRAVRKAAPFPPLGTGTREPHIEVHWHFSVAP